MLRARGHETVHAGEVGLADASDRALLAFAMREARVIVSMDSDFHALIATENLSASSTMLLREQGLDAAMVASRVAALCIRFAEHLARGCLVASREESVRVRSLPIGRYAGVKDVPGG